MRIPTVGVMNQTMTDFAFDVDLDEADFSVDPPAGYTIIDPEEVKRQFEQLRKQQESDDTKK